MKSKGLLSLILISVLALGIGIGTYAWFMDTVSSKLNTFTAGTLKVGLNVAEGEESLEVAGIETRFMEPGDVTEPVTMEISNDGNLDLVWLGYFKPELLNPNKSDRLLRAIYIKEARMDFLTPGGSAWETTDHYISNGLGHGPYPDTYNNMAEDDPFQVISLNTWMNHSLSNVMGMGKGVQVGALKPGYRYRLTLEFGFVPSAGNEYQGDKASPVKINYIVKATQVKEGALKALDDSDNVINIGSVPSQMNWLNQQLAKQIEGPAV